MKRFILKVHDHIEIDSRDSRLHTDSTYIKSSYI